MYFLVYLWWVLGSICFLSTILISIQITIFFKNQKSNIVLHITTNLLKILEILGSIGFMLTGTHFPKFQSFFKIQCLSLATNTSQLFILKYQAHFLHFQENICQIPKSEQLQFVNILLMMFCSVKKKKKKCGYFNVRLTCTNVFLQDNHDTFINSRRALCALLIPSHRIIDMFSKLRFKTLISTTLSKMYLSEIDFLCAELDCKEYNDD